MLLNFVAGAAGLEEEPNPELAMRLTPGDEEATAAAPLKADERSDGDAEPPPAPPVGEACDPTDDAGDRPPEALWWAPLPGDGAAFCPVGLLRVAPAVIPSQGDEGG